MTEERKRAIDEALSILARANVLVRIIPDGLDILVGKLKLFVPECSVGCLGRIEIDGHELKNVSKAVITVEATALSNVTLELVV